MATQLPTSVFPRQDIIDMIIIDTSVDLIIDLDTMIDTIVMIDTMIDTTVIERFVHIIYMVFTDIATIEVVSCGS